MKKSEIKKLVQNVESHCAQKGIRFTQPRRFVLEIIAGSKVPIGAYDILAKLGDYLDHPKPPTAYRAIEFLQEQGLIHRIESLNAYITCHAGHKHTGSQFMICDECGSVIEAHLCELPKDLARKMVEEGFILSSWNAELHGQCKSCSA
ncbi:MAG: transcriptional repressor [Rhodospirillales bacterium]|nr:transcriptional repressor [Alphaproteobacteria bacterium]MCB1839664.1 transcriptional repressor [Alphaproteobacteria bacterium]MCB9977949.1 transcriptional repressor [Rhodospirillales bacterium]